MKAIFMTTDREHMGRNGEVVDVLNPLSEGIAKIHGVKTMYTVRFPDGFVLDAFDKELTMEVKNRFVVRGRKG